MVPDAEISDAEMVERALRREPAAVRAFLARVVPIVQARIKRVLYRSGTRGRAVRDELQDLVQEVLTILFADGGRRLRAWDEERGMTLNGFVGLVAEREAISIMRSARRNPWTDEPTGEAVDLEPSRGEDPERRAELREELERVVAHLHAELSPLGVEVFRRVWVHRQPTPQICAELGLSADAVHAWCSRIRKSAKKLEQRGYEAERRAQ